MPRAAPVIETFDDPCALAKSLEAAYLRIIQGVQESEVEYMSNGQTRRVRYTQTDLKTLERVMSAAKDACAVASGGENRGRRFALQARHRPERFE